MACLSVLVFHILTLAGILESSDLTIVLYSIFVLEVIASDLQSSVTTLGFEFLANTFLFIRSALWVFVYITACTLDSDFRSLDALLVFWLGGLITSFVVIGIGLNSLPWNRLFTEKIDSTRLVNAAKNAGLIYTGDVANIILQYSDRFFVSWFFGLEMTGIFVFFWSLTNSINSLLSSLILQTSLKRLVVVKKDSGMAGWAVQFSNEFRRAIQGSAVLSLLVMVMTFAVIQFLKRQELMEYFPLLFALVAYACLRLVTDVAGYGLYSLGKDRPYAVTFLIGALISPFLSILFIPRFGVYGAGLSMVLSTAIILLLRLRLIKSYSES
jgi:O-antigen/teichoic acid export membrane protein